MKKPNQLCLSLFLVKRLKLYFSYLALSILFLQGYSTAQTTLPGTEEFGLSKQELVTSIETVEEHIASCMREAGFEYFAVDYNTVRSAMVSDKSLPGLSETQFVKEYGFGISTIYTGLPPQLATGYSPARLGLGEKNIGIFNRLSSPDQVAYNFTLFGEHTDASFAVALETEDFSRIGGCTFKAISEVFTPEQLKNTYVNPKDALIEQDPRMAKALQKFSDCLSKEGFNYSYERDIEPDIKARLSAITGGIPLGALSTDAKTALLELQQEERVLAVLTLTCEAKYIDPVESQIERELY